MTGSLAEQVVNGVTRMVINRSFSFQYFGSHNGLLRRLFQKLTGTPDNPNLRIILSIKKTTRLI
jgi:hypothetical protein